MSWGSESTLLTAIVRIAVLCVWVVISGCDNTTPPSASWEVAIQGLYSAAISRDSQYTAIGSIQHGGSLWDLEQRERLYDWNHTKGEYTGLVAVAFSPEGAYAATASHRTITLWETSTGKPVWYWSAPGDVLSMALTPQADFALLGLADHTAVLFDIKNGGLKRVFNHNGKVRNVSMSADARLILTGSDDRTAKLWDLQSGALLHSWPHGNQMITTALSDSGKYAFTAAQADKASIWDTETGQPIKEMPVKKGSYIAGAAYTAARFSPSETQLLTGTNSQLVQLWDIQSGLEEKRWKITKRHRWKPSSATVLAVGFDQNGRYYAIGSNGLSHELK